MSVVLQRAATHEGKKLDWTDEDTPLGSKRGRCAVNWASYEMRFGLRGRAAQDESNDTLK